jgi:hypothetical protein
MRLKGRQLRFILGTALLWPAARLAMVFGGNMGPIVGIGTLAGVAIIGLSLAWPDRPQTRPFNPALGRIAVRPPPRYFTPGMPVPKLAPTPDWEVKDHAPQLLRLAMGRSYPASPMAKLRHATFAADPPRGDAAPSPPPREPASHSGSRWTVSAYLFVRQGSGRPGLAANGQLGGSQAAARIAYRLNAEGPVRTALAVRAYAPLEGRGAEVAAGLDWYPKPGLPLRLSVERRLAVDSAGRDAWSAYVAGGFYKEPARGVTVDGYAQAGVVGARRRDLFIDGALRAGARLGPATIGAGLWGAAQPGVARLDAGPRLALAGDHLSLAVEGRFRLAGRADPGSGVTLTLASEF